MKTFIKILKYLQIVKKNIFMYDPKTTKYCIINFIAFVFLFVMIFSIPKLTVIFLTEKPQVFYVVIGVLILNTVLFLFNLNQKNKTINAKLATRE